MPLFSVHDIAVGFCGKGRLMALRATTAECTYKFSVAMNRKVHIPLTNTLPCALPGFSCARYSLICLEYAFCRNEIRKKKIKNGDDDPQPYPTVSSRPAKPCRHGRHRHCPCARSYLRQRTHISSLRALSRSISDQGLVSALVVKQRSRKNTHALFSWTPF
jgi:hypothetical protein